MKRILRQKQPDLRLFLDDVHSSQNFSAILRTCDAVGVLGLHYARITDEDVSVYDVISQGSHRWVRYERIAYAKRCDFLQSCKIDRFQVVATHLNDDALDFREVDYTKPTVIVMGNEKEGVSPDVIASCDATIKIPMFGMAQSLNVSVATAVVLFEAQRQRKLAGMYEHSALSEEEIERILSSWIYRDTVAAKSKGKIPYEQSDWLEW